MDAPFPIPGVRSPNNPFLDGQPATQPNSRGFEGMAISPDGDAKRLMLDRNNYYATTGGHGACRGCGEVTAIRLVTGANHAIHEREWEGGKRRFYAMPYNDRYIWGATAGMLRNLWERLER